MESRPGDLPSPFCIRTLRTFDEQYRISGDYEMLRRELLDHDALFVPDLVAVEMGAGGLSGRPESRAIMEREFYRARRAHGLTRQPELLSFGLLRVRMQSVVDPGLWASGGQSSRGRISLRVSQAEGG